MPINMANLFWHQLYRVAQTNQYHSTDATLTKISSVLLLLRMQTKPISSRIRFDFHVSPLPFRFTLVHDPVQCIECSSPNWNCIQYTYTSHEVIIICCVLPSFDARYTSSVIPVHRHQFNIRNLNLAWSDFDSGDYPLWPHSHIWFDPIRFVFHAYTINHSYILQTCFLFV